LKFRRTAFVLANISITACQLAKIFPPPAVIPRFRLDPTNSAFKSTFVHYALLSGPGKLTQDWAGPPQAP
jgi:hypothetical protein